jgi:hypothetical protein
MTRKQPHVQCLRCHRPMGESGYTHLCSCGMRLYCNGIWQLNMENLHTITWRNFNKDCLITSNGVLGEGYHKPLTVPWLPFTVSIEDIDKYLVLL